MQKVILTIFDKGYLARALAFYESAKTAMPGYSYIFVCGDRESVDMLAKLKLGGITVKHIDDINDPEFKETKKNRSNIEYMITAKSCWMNSLAHSNEYAEGSVLAFFDPDILFYSSGEKVAKMVEESGDSIFVTPHKFREGREFLSERSGKYNAGIVFFRKDANSRACLERWRAQCIEWCYLRNEDGKIGDQAYMSDWTEKFSGVHEIWDKGFNLGTWNAERYEIQRGTHGFTIDDEPLVCYHFHGLKIFESGKRIKAYPITVFDKMIYREYLAAIESAYAALRAHDPKWSYGFAPNLSFARYLRQSIKKAFS